MYQQQVNPLLNMLAAKDPRFLARVAMLFAPPRESSSAGGALGDPEQAAPLEAPPRGLPQPPEDTLGLGEAMGPIGQPPDLLGQYEPPQPPESSPAIGGPEVRPSLREKFDLALQQSAPRRSQLRPVDGQPLAGDYDETPQIASGPAGDSAGTSASSATRLGDPWGTGFFRDVMDKDRWMPDFQNRMFPKNLSALDDTYDWVMAHKMPIAVTTLGTAAAAAAAKYGYNKWRDRQAQKLLHGLEDERIKGTLGLYGPRQVEQPPQPVIQTDVGPVRDPREARKPSRPLEAWEELPRPEPKPTPAIETPLGLSPEQRGASERMAAAMHNKPKAALPAPPQAPAVGETPTSRPSLLSIYNQNVLNAPPASATPPPVGETPFTRKPSGSPVDIEALNRRPPQSFDPEADLLNIWRDMATGNPKKPVVQPPVVPDTPREPDIVGKIIRNETADLPDWLVRRAKGTPLKGLVGEPVPNSEVRGIVENVVGGRPVREGIVPEPAAGDLSSLSWDELKATAKKEGLRGTNLHKEASRAKLEQRIRDMRASRGGGAGGTPQAPNRTRPLPIGYNPSDDPFGMYSEPLGLRTTPGSGVQPQFGRGSGVLRDLEKVPEGYLRKILDANIDREIPVENAAAKAMTKYTPPPEPNAGQFGQRSVVRPVELDASYTQELRDRVASLKERTGMSWRQLSRESGVHFDQIASSQNAPLGKSSAEKLEAYLAKHEGIPTQAAGETGLGRRAVRSPYAPDAFTDFTGPRTNYSIRDPLQGQFQLREDVFPGLHSYHAKYLRKQVLDLQPGWNFEKLKKASGVPSEVLNRFLNEPGYVPDVKTRDAIARAIGKNKNAYTWDSLFRMGEFDDMRFDKAGNVLDERGMDHVSKDYRLLQEGKISFDDYWRRIKGLGEYSQRKPLPRPGVSFAELQAGSRPPGPTGYQTAGDAFLNFMGPTFDPQSGGSKFFGGRGPNMLGYSANRGIPPDFGGGAGGGRGEPYYHDADNDPIWRERGSNDYGKMMEELLPDATKKPTLDKATLERIVEERFGDASDVTKGIKQSYAGTTPSEQAWIKSNYSKASLEQAWERQKARWKADGMSKDEFRWIQKNYSKNELLIGAAHEELEALMDKAAPKWRSAVHGSSYVNGMLDPELSAKLVAEGKSAFFGQRPLPHTPGMKPPVSASGGKSAGKSLTGIFKGIFDPLMKAQLLKDAADGRLMEGIGEQVEGIVRLPQTVANVPQMLEGYRQELQQQDPGSRNQAILDLLNIYRSYDNIYNSSLGGIPRKAQEMLSNDVNALYRGGEKVVDSLSGKTEERRRDAVIQSAWGRFDQKNADQNRFRRWAQQFREGQTDVVYEDWKPNVKPSLQTPRSVAMEKDFAERSKAVEARQRQRERDEELRDSMKQNPAPAPTPAAAKREEVASQKWVLSDPQRAERYYRYSTSERGNALSPVDWYRYIELGQPRQPTTKRRDEGPRKQIGGSKQLDEILRKGSDNTRRRSLRERFLESATA